MSAGDDAASRDRPGGALPMGRAITGEIVSPRPGVEPDGWIGLRAFTPARIALGRAGSSQPTQAQLAFGLAHAEARDAVHAELDADALEAGLRLAGFEVRRARSRAPDRPTYLRRPDLGRRLDPSSLEQLRATASGAEADLAFVVADGLSAIAVARHALPLLRAAREHLRDWRIAPVTIALQARVALGDEIGEALQARAVAVLVGERPGLSSADSLGIYLTWAPRVGCTDAQRNCISNVRAGGLSPDRAAAAMASLLEGAKRLGATGVGLKPDAGTSAAGAGSVARRP